MYRSKMFIFQIFFHILIGRFLRTVLDLFRYQTAGDTPASS